jgi:hypothetical protein
VAKEGLWAIGIDNATEVSQRSEDVRKDPIRPRLDQGCQMVCFQNKNPNLGKFWRALDRKMFIYCMAIWDIYRYLGYFMTICYILCSFGTFFPVWVSCTKKDLATLD